MNFTVFAPNPLRLFPSRPRLLCVLLSFVFVALLPAYSETSPPGPHVFRVSFDGASFPEAWRSEGAGTATLDPLPGTAHALTVSLATRGTHHVSIPVPVETIRGLRVTLAGKLWAENVSKPAQPWNGVKLMLHVVSPRGADYQGAMNLFGTFDWRELWVSAVIPSDATEVTIVLGLQDTDGRASFEDVALSVSAVPRKRPSSPRVLLPSEKLDRRSDLARLRGVMYGPEGKEEDLRVLAKWKANLIRWQFYWYDGSFPEKRLDLASYDRWLENTMAGVDRLLPLCRELGIRIVIDLHTPPGAGESGQWAIFQDQTYQHKFIEVWDRLANHYKDQPAVWGYDLVNEPVEGKVTEGLLDWHALAQLVARRVRAIDPRHAIIIEPGPSGGWGNLPFFEPIAVPGIVYSVHMYDPLGFTHQGVLGGMPVGPVYPGVVNGVLWDKDKLRENLAAVREFQRDYQVPIYIGEFSAVRWAPDESAARYLRDCIEVFEEFGWDWSYHAFREWHGWNVEIGSDKEGKTMAAEPTARERALREGFSRD